MQGATTESDGGQLESGNLHPADIACSFYLYAEKLLRENFQSVFLLQPHTTRPV